MNQLAQETSPYLLQHKDNPVHWYPWGDAAWKKAKQEQKLVLVSIGYSACHWCHVMEHEVFEDEQCAKWMNDHFICIKVDREERPDVDHYYMDAVHLMGGRGGWPLNVFALPDGRPVYGGTYFPKLQWLNVLEKLSDLFSRDYEQMAGYAASMQRALSELNNVSQSAGSSVISEGKLSELIMRWSEHWDMQFGGAKKAPKFPMPTNLQLLQRFLNEGSQIEKLLRDKISGYIQLTLDNMAMRGLYDQIGGGFYRYSVDAEWKVPHFEKMLYDNAQLVSVYSKAYLQSNHVLYKQVVQETLQFVDRELVSEEGLFYSALDADSEGEEGKYYVWRSDELAQLLAEDTDLICAYYNIDGEALWEHGNNNLLRTLSDAQFADQRGISIGVLTHKISEAKKRMLAARSQRIRPGLDFKCITSWNAMMIKAYVEAYMVFDEQSHLQRAEEAAETLWQQMFLAGELHRIRTASKTTISGFLEDYAHLISAYITLYKATFTEQYLHRAHALMELCEEKFYDAQSSFFKFGSDQSPYAQKLELQDNVIPSSNAVLCGCLLELAVYFRNDRWNEMAKAMLSGISAQIDYAAGYSCWLMHMLHFHNPAYEVVVVGDLSIAKTLSRRYPDRAIVAASTTHSELPVMKDKFGTKSAIYVCKGQTCYAPVYSTSEAESLLK